MPNNDQPTLSAEQMAEVRAALAVLTAEPAPMPRWPRNNDELQAHLVLRNKTSKALDVLLNAAPALLALADECERLRSQCEELRARLRGLTGICEP